MTIKSDEDKAPRATPDNAHSPEGGLEQKVLAEEIQIPPTISGFFREPKATAQSFFKVLHKAKVKRFTNSDQENAADLMEKMDPAGEKLWSLMSQTSLPEPVTGWVWGAAQLRLKSVLGEAFDPFHHDADGILKSLRDTLSPRINSEDKAKSKVAENWLRIGICWLVENRSLQPWGIAERLLPYLFVDPAVATRISKRALQRGKSSDFRLAISMAGLGQEMVKTAQRERDAEKQYSSEVRQLLADAQANITRLEAEVGNLHRELVRRSESLASLEAQITAERQHWGHDLTETKAEQRVLLGEKIAPLLKDAEDALEITPPVREVALRRLKAVLAIIADEAKT